jgi:hypothetical protein
MLLASYTAASVKDLINDISAANAAGGPNTITLAANTSFKRQAMEIRAEPSAALRCRFRPSGGSSGAIAVCGREICCT